MSGRWRIHLRILCGLAVLMTGLDVLVWFHPTLGYGFGDLRRSEIQISLWLLLAFGVVSTAVLRGLRSVASDLVAWLCAYAAALVVGILAMRMLDKFY